jgi:CHAD domain-containing protein
LVRTQIDRFERALHGVERGDTESLHRARVATRRLRELVPLMRLERGAAHKLTRRLRTFTSRLGTIRESDVLLALIDELQKDEIASADVLARVGMVLGRDRDAVRQRALERLPLDDMRRLTRKLHAISEDLESERRRDARAVRWAIDARITRRASRLASGLADAGAVYLPERLHAARIAVKKLRYVLEAAGELGDAKVRQDLPRLRRAQDTLGRMHDLQVLIDRVRGVQATVTPPSVTLWRALDSLIRQLDDACRRLHARYLKARPNLQALADRLAGTTAPQKERAG